MRCAACNRRFRSKAAYELAQRYAEIHADLRLTAKITYSSTPDLSKVERHRQDSAEFRAHGEIGH